MALAIRHRDEPMAELAGDPRVSVHRETSAPAMAALQGRGIEEMERRFAAGHRAYVARWEGEPAAWGWVATRSAEIGELRSAFELPAGERYLWNFVTLAAHRGRGIYPRLLRAIMETEGREAERFWIAYAPENHASAGGIARAGFTPVAELSFDGAGGAAVRALSEGGGALAARLLGLPEANGALAPCWRCIRAGKTADRACREGACCCDYQRPDRACA